MANELTGARDGAAKHEARLRELDGLRGVAILLVLLFHYFARWAGEGLYPYGAQFAGIEPARSGFIGVELFFIISGFVITRSLRSSRNIVHFAAKRLDRLLLPMLVLSTLTFVLLSGPLRTPVFPMQWANLLPSWTFTTPALWTWLDSDVAYVDGVYWSLFIEIQFYAIIAILWFVTGATNAVRLFAATAIVGPVAARALGFDHLGLLPYAPLFACGAIYSLIFDQRAKATEYLLLVVLIPASFINPMQSNSAITIPVAIAIFHAVFLAVSYRSAWTRVLAFKPLVGAGAISYSLYLIHQNLGVALISRLPREWPLAAQLAGVLVVTGLAIAIAAASFRMLEQRRFIQTVYKKITARRSVARPVLPDAAP